MGLGDFLDRKPKAQGTKVKIHKWDTSNQKASAQDRNLLTRRGSLETGGRCLQVMHLKGVHAPNI